VNHSDLYQVLRQAGHQALSLRSSGLKIERKIDGSPVTAADFMIDALLANEMPKLTTPASKYWSEERPLPPSLDSGSHHWIIDPIDGTKEFIKGSTDWVIQGALLDGDQLSLGFVFQPATETLWMAQSKAPVIERWSSATNCTELTPLPRRSNDNITLVRSSSNPDPAVEEILNRHPGFKFFRRGSVGLKAITLCEGQADVYINFSRQCGPWDLLPCIPLLEAAGLRLHWLDEGPKNWTEPKIQSRFVMGSDEIIETLFPKISS